MNCLWCDQEIIVEINWSNLVIMPKPVQLCGKCSESLEILHGNQCKKCSRICKEEICDDCYKWSDIYPVDPLVCNVSVYAYSEQMQAMVAKWKYRGDYILADAFRGRFAEKFSVLFPNASKDMIVVPIPLSTVRLKERGFNQAKVLANFLQADCIEALSRVHGEKQSKKTRKERISSTNPFKMNKKVNKEVVLVDDIYTTGTTLRHAATLLIEWGCPKVYAYTLVRG